MTDRRSALLLRAAPAGLVLILALALLAPEPEGLALMAREPSAATAVDAALDAMPDAPTVVVGFDPDVGTYPEIRPTVRTLLADLLARDAQLVVVSLTPEGRALLLAELERLETSIPANAIVDLGFVAGSEAALVSLSRTVNAADLPDGAGSRRLAAEGLAAADLIVVIGGNDMGPRSWVEQVLPRVDRPPMVAVSPTALLPELLPYVESGQLDALVGTPGDGAAYRASVDAGVQDAADDRRVDRLGVLLGLLIGIGVLGEALGGRLLPRLRAGRRTERS